MCCRLGLSRSNKFATTVSENCNVYLFCTMKTIPHSRLLGLLFAFLAVCSATAQNAPPLISAWGVDSSSPTNAFNWFNGNNWINGTPSGVGSTSWLNFNNTQFLSVGDWVQKPTFDNTSSRQQTFFLAGGIPANNSLSVTDGTNYWSQSKGSTNAGFIVTYIPGSTSVTVTYAPTLSLPSAAGSNKPTISISYATITPQSTGAGGDTNILDVVGTTDHVNLSFSKVLDIAPSLDGHFKVLDGSSDEGSGVYEWVCNGVSGNFATGTAYDQQNPTLVAGFAVTYNRITHLLTVTYSTLDKSGGPASSFVPRKIYVKYNTPKAPSLTLGTLGIGDQSVSGAGENISVRMNSLTFDNNGAMANVIKTIGNSTDEIASGVHLAGPLALAVRTAGDVNTGFRLSGPIDGKGGLVKLDSGNLVITGNNTFSGPMIIRDTGGTTYLRTGLTLNNCSMTISNTTLKCDSTLGLSVGMTVSGTNILPNSVVTSVGVDGTTFTLNTKANATATGVTLVAKNSSGLLVTNAGTTLNSRLVTCNPADGLELGMTLTGTSMPADATVVAIAPDRQSFTMNSGATGTSSGITLVCKAGNFSLPQLTLTGASIPLNSSTVTCADTTGLLPGMLITDTSGSTAVIPANAAVASVLSSTQFTITQPSANGGGPLTLLAVSQALAIVGNGITLPTITLAPVPLPTMQVPECTLTKSSAVVLCSNLTNVKVGMFISGANLAAGSKVLAVDSVNNTFTLNLGATNKGTHQILTLGTATTNLSNQITCYSNLGLAVGMSISGTNIPANATITSIPPTSANDTIHFTISAPATATGDGPRLTIPPSVGTATTVGSNTVITTGTTSKGLAPNMFISTTSAALPSGTLPSGTKINSIPSAGSVTFTASNNATATANGLTLQVGSIVTNASSTVTVASTTGIVPGMIVRGPGIPSDTVITAVDAPNFAFTMSRPATSSSSLGAVTVAPTPGLGLAGSTATPGSATITTTASVGALQPGTLITGPGIPENAYVVSVGTGSFDISVPVPAGITNALLTAVTAQGLVLTNCVTTAASANVTCDCTTGLARGSLISGPNMPNNAVVVSVTDSTHFVISSVATAATTAPVTLTATSGGYQLATSSPSPFGVTLTGGQTVLNSNIVTCNFIDNTGNKKLQPGMLITGTNIPVNAILLSVGTDNSTATPRTFLELSAPVAVPPSSGLTWLAIPANVKGLAILNAATTINSPTIACTNTAGLRVGQIVSGTASVIPANAQVSSITDSTHFVINTPALATATGLTLLTSQPQGSILSFCTTTLASTTVGCPNSTGLDLGMAVTGLNMPNNAVITDVPDSTHFVISTPAAATGSNLSLSAGAVSTQPIYPAATLTGSVTVSCGSTKGLNSGQAVFGDGIPAGAKITTINSGTVFSISSPATATSPAAGVTLMAVVPVISAEVVLTHAVTLNNNRAVTCDSTVGMVVGMSVGGPNIPSATTVTMIVNKNTFVMSLPATGDGWGLTLGVGTNAISSSTIQLGTANRDGNSTAVLQLQASNQINDNAVLNFDAASGRSAYLRTQGFNETVAGVLDWTANGVIENTESENGVFTSSILTLNTSQNFDFNGFIRNRSGGDSTGMIGITKIGTNTLGLSGSNVSYTGDTIVRGGGLKLTNTTSFGSNISVSRTSNLELSATSDWQLNQIISGGGSVTKTGANTITLANDSNYTGATSIDGGTLRLTAAPLGVGLPSGNGSTTKFQATLGRNPAPGTLFFSELDLTNASNPYKNTWLDGKPNPPGITITYDWATRIFTAVYATPPPTGRFLQLTYRPADTQRVGNTNGSDKDFTATLATNPVGVWYVTDGVTDTWVSTQGSGTASNHNLFTVTVTGTTSTTVTVSYASPPAYGRAITAVWTGPEGLTNTSSLTLNSGTLAIDNSATSFKSVQFMSANNSTDRVNDAAPIFSNGGSILFRVGGNDTYSETLGVLNPVGGMTTIQTFGFTSTSSKLTFASLNRAQGSSATLFFNSNFLGQDSTTNSIRFTTAPALSLDTPTTPTSAGIIGGWAVVQDGPLDFATYDTVKNSVRSLGGTNARATTIDKWTAATDAYVRGSITGPGTGNVVVDSLVLSSSGAITLDLKNKQLTVNTGGIIFNGNTGGTTHTIAAGTTLTAGAASGNELFLWTNNLAQTNTVAATIINNPLVGTSTAANQGMTVVKSGLGEVKLSGPNTYTGGTRIYGGDIEITALGNLGQLAGSSLNPDFLLMNGGSLQIPGKTDGSSTSVDFGPFYGLTLGPAGGSIALDVSVTVSIESPIVGPGGFSVGNSTVANQSNGGNVILSGNNTFQGNLQVILGTLTIQGGSNTFTKGVLVAGTGAALDIHDGSALPVNPSLTITGGDVMLGSSAKIGALSGADGTEIKLEDDSGTPGVQQVITPGMPITLTINQASNTTFSGIIEDATDYITNLGIDKRGPGILTLAPSDLGASRGNYSGATRISEGILATNNLAFRGSSSNLGTGRGSFLHSEPAASMLYIEDGAGLSFVGTIPSTTNRAFTLGVGGLGSGIFANGSGISNVVKFTQGTLYDIDGYTSISSGPQIVYYDGKDNIAFSRPNEAATLNLGGRNIGDNTFALDLHDNGVAPLSVQKSGDGNWVLGQPIGTNVTLTHCAIGVLTPGGTPNANTIYCDTTASLVVGMLVIGDPSVIPVGTRVATVVDAHTFTTTLPVSATIVTASETLTSVPKSANTVLTNCVLAAPNSDGSPNPFQITCDTTANITSGMAIIGDPTQVPLGTIVSVIVDSHTFITSYPLTSRATVPMLTAVADSASDYSGNTTIYLGTLAIGQNGALGAPTAASVNLTNCVMTANSSSVACSSTLGLVPGMPLSGPGIRPGTQVTAVTDSTHFVINMPAALAFPLRNCTVATGGTIVSCAYTEALAPGMTVSGPGIPTGTTIVAVLDGKHFSISQAATSVLPTISLLNCATTQGSSLVACTSTSGLQFEMELSGAGLDLGTRVLRVVDSTHFIMSTTAGQTLSAGNTIVALPVLLELGFCKTPLGSTVLCGSTAGLVPGMSLNGLGLEYGVSVASVTDSSHFVMSAPLMFGYPDNNVSLGACTTTTGSTTVTCASTSSLSSGVAVKGPGLNAGSIVASITDSTHFELSVPAITGGTGLTIQAIRNVNITASVTLSASIAAAPSSTTSAPVSLVAAGGGVVQLVNGNLDLRNVKYSSPKTLTLDGGRLRGLTGNSLWQGAVIADVNTNIEVGPGAAVDLASAISGRAGFTKLGFGTLTLEGNNSFNGTVNVSEGTLQLDYTSNHGGKLPDNSSLILGGGRKGGTIDIIGNATGNTETVKDVTLNLGQNRITRTDPTSHTAMRLNAITINQGATLDVQYFAPNQISGLVTTLNSDTITVSSTAGLVTGLVVTGPNIPAGTTIVSISGTSITLSKKATGSVSSGATLSIPSGNSTPNTATTDRPNDGVTDNASTGILGPWATVNLSDWAANSNNTSSANDGIIVPYSQYSQDIWGGSKSNVNVTGGGTQTGATAYTLRYGANTSTTLTLVGDNFLLGGGILQAPSVGAVNNIITGGRLVLGNNLQGGNLVIRQNDDVGSLQINSVVANAPDILIRGAISYNGNAGNRFALAAGSTSTFYTGMPVVGPNVRPGSTINGFSSSTSFNISQNIASPLTFGQGTAATPPPPTVFTVDLMSPTPVTFAANTRVGGVPGVYNQIHLTTLTPPVPALAVGQTVSGTGIPAGTVITAILTSTVAGTDFLLSNDVPLQVGVDLTFGPVQGVNNQIRVYYQGDPSVAPSILPIVVGQLVTEAGVPTGVIPPGTVVSSLVSTRLDPNGNLIAEYLLNNDIVPVTGAPLTGVSLQFTMWGELLVGGTFPQIIEDIGSPGSPNLINTYQVHLSVGTNFGLVKDQTVAGLGIPPGATIFKTIGTADFTYTFPKSRVLTVGNVSGLVGDIAVGAGGTQIHLTTGTTTGLTANMPVSGDDIPPGSLYVPLASGGGTDFLISRSVFAPIVDVTVYSRNGALKAGTGLAQLTGANTFTGGLAITGGTLSVPQISNGNTPSPLGASSGAAGNLTIGGGTLQYTGNNATVNRGFTINEIGAVDVSYAGVTASFTGNLSGGGGAAAGTLQKTGMGTLQITRTTASGGAQNIGAFDVENGTLRLLYANPNAGNGASATDTTANNRFAAQNAAVTLGGGKLELAGVKDTPSASNLSEDRVQNLTGQLTLNTGASQIWATAAKGTNVTLNLQDPTAPTDVIRQAGATVLFVENPLNGLTANITLALNYVNQATVLPWAVYQDTSERIQPGVNNFAEIEPLDNGVIPADRRSGSYSLLDRVNEWSFGEHVVSESGAPFTGTLLMSQGSTMQVDGIRFFAKSDGVVDIANPTSASASPQNTLSLALGAILAGTNSGNASKTIQGGLLTSQLQDVGTNTNDFIIHNYNLARPLDIKSEIIDYRPSLSSANRPVNLVITGTGTTILEGSSAASIWTIYPVGDSRPSTFGANPNFQKNSYTGTTFITGGVLRLGNATALPGGIAYNPGGTGSNVVLAGGVLGIASDFTRAVGPGGTQIQWSSSGGFAGYGAAGSVVQVNLGAQHITDTPSQLTWSASGFLQDSNQLILGAVDGTATVRLLNPINLGGSGREVNVIDGPAAIDGELAGGLSGNGGSLRKVGQGTLRLSGGQGLQTGGAILGQGKLSTSATSLGTGPLGIGNTDSTGPTDALILELRGGTFNSPVTVGNTNSQAITSINAISSPTLNGTMSLGRQTFFGPAQGRRITLGGGLLDTVDGTGAATGNGAMTLVDGGAVVLNGAGTLGSKDAAGPGGNHSVVLRSGSLYLGNNNALGAGTGNPLDDPAKGRAVVQIGDAPANRIFQADRSTIGRSVLIQGGVYEPRSNGIPGSGNGRGAFLFQSQSQITVDDVIYAEKDSLVDGDITQGVGGASAHKRTIVLVNGESDSPDRNGLYQLIFHYGDPISLTNCTTSVSSFQVRGATINLNSSIIQNCDTSKVRVGMVVTVNGSTGSGSIPAGARVSSILDASTFKIDQLATATATAVTLVFTQGTTTVTCADTSLLAIGMPLFGAQIPANTVVNSIVDGTTFTMNNLALGAASGLTLTARGGDSIALGRISEFDDPTEMVYGVRTTVANGSDAGKTFFLAMDVALSFDQTFDPSIPIFTPVWWKQDLVNPNVALLSNSSGLTIGNSIDINNTSDLGAISLGGSTSMTTGSSTFTGNVILQNGAFTLTGCITANGSTTVTTDTTAAVAVGMKITDNGSHFGGASPTVVSVTDGQNFVVSVAASRTDSGQTFTATAPAGNRSVRLLSDTVDGRGVVFSGVFSEASASGGSLALQKLGTGTVTLSGSNLYTGGTTISSGTLLVNNISGSGTGLGAVTASNFGTTLGGTGFIGGTTTLSAGALLSPGDPAASGIGTLSFNGNLSLGVGSSALFELGGADNDLVHVSGMLSVDPSVILHVVLEYIPTAAIDVDILSWGLPSSGLSLVDLLDLPALVTNQFYWDTSTFNTDGTLHLKAHDSSTPVARFAVRKAQTAETPGGSTIRVSVQLDQPAGKQIFLPIKVAGSATMGADFDLLMAGQPAVATAPLQTLQFNTGDSSADITINVHDDPIAEPSETVVLTIVEPTGLDKPVLKGSPGTFTLTITDNDGSIPMGVQWVEQNPTPTNEKMQGIAAAATTLTPSLLNTTVAVGSTGEILYYADADATPSWKIVNTGLRTSFHAVAARSAVGSAPAVFVAVGDGGVVLTSPNGINWTYHSTSGDKPLYGVTWSSAVQQFIAVGGNGVIYTSPNGTSWHYQVSGLSNDLAAVSAAGSVIVAVGANGSLATTDGVISLIDGSQTWTPRDAGLTTNLRGVTAKAGVYVAVGDGGAVTTSSDGLAWSKLAPSGISANLLGVFADSSAFFATGAAGAIYKSTTGASWTSVGVAAIVDDLFAGAVTPGNKSIIVGNSGVIAVNNGGSTWSRASSPTGPNTSTTLPFDTVAFNGTRFVATGLKGVFARADRTDAFTQGLQGFIGSGTARLAAMAAGAVSQMVAVGDAGAAFVSADGIAWASSATSVSANLRGITYGNGYYCAVGENGTILKGVATGNTIAWSVITSNSSENLTGIAFSGKLWLAVGANGTVLSSPDGLNWDDISPGGFPALAKVVWTGSQFLIVGAGGTVLTATVAIAPDGTPGGVSFARSTTNVSANLADVVWTITGAFAVGDSGTILQSNASAGAWTPADSGTGQNLRSIAYSSADSRLVVVGESGTILSSQLFTAPNPSVYFASTEMTVDERIGIAQVPVFFTQIPTHDLYMTFTTSKPATDGATVTSDYTATSPLKIPVSGITAQEIADGAMTRYLPVTIVPDKLLEKTESLTITITGFVMYTVNGKTVKTPVPDQSVTVITDQNQNVMTLTITDTVAPTVNFPAGQHQMVKLGDPLSITSTITGSSPVIQWLKNGAGVAGVTTSTLNVPAVTLANAGAYTVKVTNPAGTDATNRKGVIAPDGTVEVTVIDQTDKLVLVKPLGSTVLTAVVGGNGFSYQWFKNGSPTALTTGADYTVAGVKLTIKKVDTGLNDGDYFCTVTQNLTGHNTGVTGNTGMFQVRAAKVPDIIAPSPVVAGKVGAAYYLKIPRLNSADPLNPAPDSPYTPVTFTATGLPAGLTINSLGEIKGTPTVSTMVKLVNVPATVKVTATNPAGPKVITFALTIAPLDSSVVGAFVGLADRSGSPDADIVTKLVYGTLGLGARFDLTTTSSPSYSGFLTVGPTRYSFTGKLVTTADGSINPHGTATITRGTGKSSLVIDFFIDPATSLVTGTVTDAKTIAALSGWRNIGATTANTVNIVCDIAGGPPTDGTRPEGASYASIAVVANGTVVVSGRTADGYPVATAGVLGPTGQVLIYQSLYTIAGSFAGQVNVDLNNAVVLPATGTVSWSHPRNAIANRTYVSGWPQAPVALTVIGGKYYAPLSPGIFMGLPDNSANGDTTNAQLDFSGGGVPSALPPVTVPPSLSAIQITAAGAVITPTGSLNPTSTSLIITPKTGAFTGTFTLTNSGVSRKVTYQGLVVPITSTPVLLDGVGYGYFLLPKLADPSAVPPTTAATSPIQSGLVVLEKK